MQVSKNDKRNRAAHATYQEDEEKRWQAQQFDTGRSKSFHFLNVRSILIAKLKLKSIQKVDICEYKIDMGDHGNLMPIRM